MISFLLTVLAIAVVAYVIYLILNFLPLPDPIKTIAYLILGLIILFWLLGAIGVGPGIGGPVFR